MTQYGHQIVASQTPRQLKTIIAANLRAARAEKRVKQRDVAQALDTDVMSISRWERGLHQPADATLFQLADFYDRDYVWFLTDHQREDVAA